MCACVYTYIYICIYMAYILYYICIQILLICISKCLYIYIECSSWDLGQGAQRVGQWLQAQGFTLGAAAGGRPAVVVCCCFCISSFFDPAFATSNILKVRRLMATATSHLGLKNCSMALQASGPSCPYSMCLTNYQNHLAAHLRYMVDAVQG